MAEERSRKNMVVETTKKAAMEQGTDEEKGPSGQIFDKGSERY